MNPTHYNRYSRTRHLSSGKAATAAQLNAAAAKCATRWPSLVDPGPVAECGQVLYPDVYRPIDTYKGRVNRVCKKCTAKAAKR